MQPSQAGITRSIILGHQFMQMNAHIPDPSREPHQHTHTSSELPELTRRQAALAWTAGCSAHADTAFPV